METKGKIQNKLYLPIKINNGKREYMFNSHGKIKAYKSISTLIMYSKDCDEIATYILSGIKFKEEI